MVNKNSDTSLGDTKITFSSFFCEWLGYNMALGVRGADKNKKHVTTDCHINP